MFYINIVLDIESSFTGQITLHCRNGGVGVVKKDGSSLNFEKALTRDTYVSILSPPKST
jgi:hypothetical protein